METLDLLPEADLKVWTDGSVESAIKNGGAGIILETPSFVEHHHLPTGEICSSYRAELIALEKALDLIQSNQHLQQHRNIRVCTDSQSALITIKRGPSKQSETTAINIWTRLQQLSESHQVVLQWIPGHANIRGNELADREANKGRYRPQMELPIDQQTVKAAIKRFAKEKFENTYLRDPHTHHHRQSHKHFRREPLERSEEITLNQLRVGHCPITRAYLARIGKSDCPTCPHCKAAPETVTHLLLECPIHSAARLDHLGPNPTLQVLSSRQKGTRTYLAEVGALVRPPDP